MAEIKENIILERVKKTITETLNKVEKQGAENALHLKILNSEMGETAAEQKIIRKELVSWKITNEKEHGIIQTDLSWVKKFQWIIISASAGALIAGLINLL